MSVILINFFARILLIYILHKRIKSNVKCLFFFLENALFLLHLILSIRMSVSLYVIGLLFCLKIYCISWVKIEKFIGKMYLYPKVAG